MDVSERQNDIVAVEVPASAKYSNGRRSPLAKPGWRYVEGTQLAEYSAEEWESLRAQGAEYYAEEKASAALRMLETMKDDPSFGFQVNNYTHCLQSATMVMRAGYDEESIVCALFHDIGFIACVETHGQFSAALMGPVVSEKNYWMLRHHQIFMERHMAEDPSYIGDAEAREVYRGHPHFEWTAEFVDKYDQNALQADYDTASIDIFRPMVHRVFAQTPHAIPVID